MRAAQELDKPAPAAGQQPAPDPFPNRSTGPATMPEEAPSFTGVRVYSTPTRICRTSCRLYRLDAVPRQTYEFKGRYPADPSRTRDQWGRPRSALFDDAQEMLKQIVDERWFNGRRAIIGFWPANVQSATTSRVFTGESRSEDKLATLLRPAPAIDQEVGTGAPTPGPVRLRGAGRDGDRRLRRRLRGDRRAWRRCEIAERFKDAGQRRLPLDPGQGAR